jgi:hypothetical protein
MRITALLAALFATIVVSTDSNASIDSIFKSPNPIKDQVAYAAMKRGWDTHQVQCLHTLIKRESGYNPRARNPKSSASGLFQMIRAHTGIPAASLPVSKQIQHGFRYITKSYRTPCSALAFNMRRGWY